MKCLSVLKHKNTSKRGQFETKFSKLTRSHKNIRAFKNKKKPDSRRSIEVRLLCINPGNSASIPVKYPEFLESPYLGVKKSGTKIWGFIIFRSDKT